MNFLDSFIITQKSIFYLSNLWVLLFGALINFAICGLFAKKSQIISNVVTIVSLILASSVIKPAMLGFLNPHGLQSLSYFNSRIILNGANIEYCLILNFAVLGAFLISLKHLKHLRHKAHYFNALYLTAALASNIMLLSADFLTFILSLEAFFVSSLFIILGFKNKKILYLSLKYFLFGLLASSFMIFGWALSKGFSTVDGILLLVSKIIFISGFLLKGGFFALLAQQRQSDAGYNYPSFVFINTAAFVLFCLGFLKITQNLLSVASVVQLLLIVLFTIFIPVCALKIIRAKDFETFVFSVNSLNFSSIAFCFLLLSDGAYSAGIYYVMSALILMFALLSAGAIFDYNHKNKHLLADFKGVCLTNPLYCAGLSTALFIGAGVLPSGILCARIYSIFEILNIGLWTTIPLFFIIIAYSVALCAIVKFAIELNKKPSCIKDLKETELKKRTRLNFFILFISLTVLIIMCFSSSVFINLTTNFQQIPRLF